jgi:hypothetical protein
LKNGNKKDVPLEEHPGEIVFPVSKIRHRGFEILGQWCVVKMAYTRKTLLGRQPFCFEILE